MRPKKNFVAEGYLFGACLFTITREMQFETSWVRISNSSKTTFDSGWVVRNFCPKHIGNYGPTKTVLAYIWFIKRVERDSPSTSSTPLITSYSSNSILPSLSVPLTLVLLSKIECGTQGKKVCHRLTHVCYLLWLARTWYPWRNSSVSSLSRVWKERVYNLVQMEY